MVGEVGKFQHPGKDIVKPAIRRCLPYKYERKEV